MGKELLCIPPQGLSARKLDSDAAHHPVCAPSKSATAGAAPRLTPNSGAPIIGSNVRSTFVLSKPTRVGAMPQPWAHWQWSSYGRPVLCPVHIFNGGLDHTPGLLGCLCEAKPSRLPMSVCWSLSFSTQPLCAPAGMCLGLGSAATWQPSVPVPLYSAWQQASTHTLLSRKFQTIPASYQLKWTFQPAKNVPRARDLFPFHSSLPGVQVPSSFIFFFFPPFFLPSYVGSLLQLWLYKRSSARFQWILCENCSTCRCIFDVLVGGRWAPRCSTPPSWTPPHLTSLNHYFVSAHGLGENWVTDKMPNASLPHLSK